MKKKNNTDTPAEKQGSRKIWLTVGCGIGVLLVVFLMYFADYSHADESVEAALSGSESVKVTKIDGGYYFDGPSEDTAFILYPGAKVEASSYAPLMLKLAEKGIDGFIAEMPFNFALFNVNAADTFINGYDYSSWILGGHSLGGVAAASYASEHTNTVSGVVLLASYSTTKFEDGIKVCSIYGSEDGCLNMEEYEKNRENLPGDALEYVIEGGNHSGFGSYGLQSGDGTALISAEEQQKIIADVICEFFAN